jgi:hypothetical protein
MTFATISFIKNSQLAKIGKQAVVSYLEDHNMPLIKLEFKKRYC